MFNDSKDVKSLSLKISFFASIFLLLFMMGITAFAFLYFFLDEVNTINREINSATELSPTSINEAIIMRVKNTDNYVDADKLSLAIESNNLRIKEIFNTNSKLEVVLSGATQSSNEFIAITAEPASKVSNIFGSNEKSVAFSKLDEKQPLFELARDSLIIDRDGRYTANGIFNFESFDIEDLLLRSPGLFTQNIGNRLYLFKKISTDDYEIVFTKDISYIIDFAFKMFFVGIISSILFFLLVYILSTYLVKLFLKPINEYNTKLKEYNHNLAHEIKTPLTVVNMNLDLLENDENRQIVESNKEEIEKIKNITDSLLFLSENFALREIQKLEINECVNKYISKSIHRDNIEIINSKKPIEVMANKNMFDRLLKNLCENAMKYSTDRHLVIKITDNAIYFTNKIEKPISQKDLHMIFEAFYQIDNSRNDSGYGLGLTLIKRIVDIFKWRIDIDCTLKEFIVKIEF